MEVKHFTHTSDFTKDDYLKVFEITKKLEKAKDLTNVCKGKVLVFCFLKESTRTLTAFQSAILKLGGGWSGITTIKGTYLETGEEDLQDTIRGIIPGADVLVIRGGKELDFSKIKAEVKIPIINAMGADEHTIAGLCFGYFLWKKFKNLKNLKVGFYGMTGASRPALAACRVLSNFGGEVYEDPVVEQLGFSSQIKEELTKKGLKIYTLPIDEFIGKVDFLWIVEGLPVAGTPDDLVNEFNKKVKIIDCSDVDRLKDGAFFYVCEPRFLTDKRCTVEKKIDEHSKCADFIKEAFLPAIMGTLVYLIRGKL